MYTWLKHPLDPHSNYGPTEAGDSMLEFRDVVLEGPYGVRECSHHHGNAQGITGLQIAILGLPGGARERTRVDHKQNIHASPFTISLALGEFLLLHQVIYLKL